MLAQGIHQGIEARVIGTDGFGFEEHQVVHNPGTCPESTCFLEIQEGKTFKIEVILTSPILRSYHSGDWDVSMWIDGKFVSSDICDGPGEQSRTVVVKKKRFIEAGKQVAGSLQFSAVTVMESDLEAAKTENLGQIVVKVQPGTAGLPGPDRVWSDGAQIASSATERQAKRTSSTVTLTEVVPSTYISVDWSNRPDREAAKFTFSYRTKAKLMLLEVIPLTFVAGLGEAQPRPQKRKRSGSAESTEPGASGSQLEIYATMLAMRREVDALRENVRNVRKKVSRDIGQVVDLTGDDSD